MAGIKPPEQANLQEHIPQVRREFLAKAFVQWKDYRPEGMGRSLGHLSTLRFSMHPSGLGLVISVWASIGDEEVICGRDLLEIEEINPERLKTATVNLRAMFMRRVMETAGVKTIDAREDYLATEILFGTERR